MPANIAHAEAVVSVAMNQAIPPYAISESDSGLMVDIIKATFAQSNTQAIFHFVPATRMVSQFAEQKTDVTTRVKPDMKIKGFFSHFPIMTFKPQAISLSKKKIHLEKIEDMARYRVVAFQGARNLLGDAFFKMTQKNPNYSEVSNMPTRMLDLDRADLIISDAGVFMYYATKAAGISDPAALRAKFQIQDILADDLNYWFAFKDEKQREQFENGLSGVYRSGEIDKIVNSYESKFGNLRYMITQLDCRFATAKKPKACGN
jgi:polar amino acid transport system substrate-binding protein